jgi:oligoribonuclease NrnB/cAMP/cGMP phosphodiesterase (DHH superfamily)
MDLIYYHGNCTDGWAAAYVAHLKYPEAKLVPAFYSTEPPYEEVEGKDVLMVDFAWKGRDVNIKLNLLAKSLRIFEHHKTAGETLKNLEFVTYDVTRSGAGLAWDYLFGKDSGLPNGKGERRNDGYERPWWVNYVEDYDIWNKKLPLTDSVNMYLHALPHEIKVWDDINSGLIPYEYVESVGEGMRQQQAYQVKSLVAMSNSGRGWGCTVGFVNAPYFFTSDVGHELAKTHDIGMTWQVRKDGLVAFGLRSIGDIDVSKVAKRLGGGGHKNSAGFELSQGSARSLLEDILKAGPEFTRVGGCVS